MCAYTMAIQLTRKDNESLKEYSFMSRPVEGNAGMKNQKKEDGSPHSAIASRIASRNSTSLASRDALRPGERQTLTPAKQSFSEKNGTVFLDKEIRAKIVCNNDKAFFSLNFDTEILKDHYAIDKVVFYAPDQVTNKYKKAQVYHTFPESIFEVFA